MFIIANLGFFKIYKRRKKTYLLDFSKLKDKKKEEDAFF